MKNQKFSIKARIKSFSYALNGLKVLIKNEHNARIHFVAMILVIIASFVLKINKNEWLSIIIVIGFVFSMEIINSAIEQLADFVSPNYQEIIKKVKDLSAAAVLISALVSVIVAFIIFIPKIIELL
jgi:diacylglycerol kinase